MACNEMMNPIKKSRSIQRLEKDGLVAVMCAEGRSNKETGDHEDDEALVLHKGFNPAQSSDLEFPLFFG